jgi:CheY-like chemotaxis protein
MSDPVSSLPTRDALVVDDDAPTRALVAHLLQRDGFRVDTAADGAEALPLLRGRGYEVIVLDLAMPGMNGMELLEHLRHRMPAALRRIVVVTASLHLLRHGFPEDICRVITKPFTLDQFRAAIIDCMAPAAG